MNDDPIRSQLEAIAPEAARTVISGWVQAKHDTPAADLIRMAVAKLPVSGRIRGKQETIVKGLTYLLAQVPPEDVQKEDLSDAVGALVERARGRQRP